MNFIIMAWVLSAGCGCRCCWMNMADAIQHRQHVERVRRREVVDPQGPGCVAQLHAVHQHVVQREEDRYLDQRSGRQPLAGLIFSFLYSSIIAWLSLLAVVLVALLQLP